MLRLRNYRSGEVHNVQSTTEWWGGGKVMMKWLDSSRLSRVVNSFGEFAIEHYLISRTCFKRILRIHDCFLGFWVTVGLHGNWWKSNDLNPTKERLYKGSKGRRWKRVDKTLRKRREERERERGEEGRITFRGKGGVVQKNKNKNSKRDNWKRTIQLVFEAIFM